MKKKHHLIPFEVLLIPGGFLLVSVFLMLFGHMDWAFLFVGIAIVVAIMIHKED